MSAEFEIQGMAISAIARRFGTPLFVYDANVLTASFHRLRRLLHLAVDIYFSLKANPNISVCALLRSLGAGAEVSSQLELVTALRAGVPPENVIFLGPGKSRTELAACVETGIHAVVCESIDELAELDALAGRKPVHAMLRVNPDFAVRGTGLTMGGRPRQFGIDLSVLRRSRPVLAGLRSVRIIGIHAYLGTRFLNACDVVDNTRHILATAEELGAELGIPLETVDFGGGLGVAYFDNETDPDLDALGAGLHEAVAPFHARHPGCRLIMELGRYLTATAGTYVVRARQIKQSMNEWFIVADGGTNHHMAAVGIGSFVRRNFPIRVLTRYQEPATRAFSISGPLCTPHDLLGKRVPLPEVSVGDLIGVLRSGAYGPSASPGLFLGHGHPAEVMVSHGEAHLVRDRDTVEDMLGKQHLIEFPAGRGAAR
jgi:diaminopimelate decarboxylase